MDPTEPKKAPAESGGEEGRGATARRFRVPQREFSRLAGDHVPEDQKEAFWHRLSGVCPARPSFEGSDVFTVLGALMFLYGLSWGLSKAYETIGVLAFSIAALALSVVLLVRAEGWSREGRGDGVPTVAGLAACALVFGGWGGFLDSSGLAKWVGTGEVGRTVLVTLVCLGPLAFAIRLLGRGLQAPMLVLVGLCAAGTIGGAWAELLLDPDKYGWWAMAMASGLALLRAGYSLDRRTHADLAGPIYAVGLFLVWWVGLVWMPVRGEAYWLGLAAGSFLFMVLAALLERGMFLTCGALGVYAWMGHLAFDVFRGALLFPMALTFTGLAIMGSGLLFQRRRDDVMNGLRSLVPEALRPELPGERPAPPPPPEVEEAVEEEAPPPPPGPATRLDLAEDEVREVAEEFSLGEAARDGLWASLAAGNPVRARLTLANILYFLGALTVIASMTFFMGLSWSTLGDGAVLGLSVGYAALFAFVGGRFWRSEDTRIPGGLLVTMAVCMVPLATWALQSVTGFWPTGDPGAYGGLYRYVKSEWLVIEVATIAASLLALRSVRFPFLVAPMAFAGWYMSMDLAPLLLGSLNWQSRCYVSLGFGLLMILVSRLVDRRSEEDYAYWGYLFGVLAFWGGLSLCGSGSMYGKLIYAAINLGMMFVGARLGRGVFMVFGFLGFHGWLARELHLWLGGVPGYPLLVALAGFGVYRFGRWVHRRGGFFPRAA